MCGGSKGGSEDRKSEREGRRVNTHVLSVETIKTSRSLLNTTGVLSPSTAAVTK